MKFPWQPQDACFLDQAYTQPGNDPWPPTCGPRCPWGNGPPIGICRPAKNKISLENYASKTKFDIIYFDAFSPEKQPQLWTVEIFKNMYHLLKEELNESPWSKGS